MAPKSSHLDMPTEAAEPPQPLTSRNVVEIDGPE